MWKLLVILTMIFSLCAVAGCDVKEMRSLEDIARPHVGVYECERLLIGGEDCNDDFEFLRLELAYGGDFTLSYQTKSGKRDKIEGTYSVDTTRDEVTMSVKHGIETLSRTYRMENGTILIDGSFLGTSLFAEFK